MLLPLKALVDGRMRYYGGRFKDPGFFAQESLVAKSIRGKNLRCEFVYFIQMTLNCSQCALLVPGSLARRPLNFFLPDVRHQPVTIS
jgi:hypothetical protein